MKVTIKGIIKENKEDILVDRVVESLLGDTTYEVYHRFMGEIISEIKCPWNDGDPIYYNESEIRSHLNAFKNMTEWGYMGDTNLNIYMEQNYGITDDTILGKIYLKYYTVLLTNILNDFDNYERKPMNESVERKEDTLNRIVDFMIQDTKWDIHMEHEDNWEYVEVSIYWPGGDRDDYKLFDMEVDWDMFHTGERDIDYIKNNFGITEKWITQELYNRYINKLRPIIYEEMKNFEE